MIPGDFPLDLYRGDTGRWQFKLWTDTGKTQPADLTGATAAAQIRDKVGGQAITQLTVSITAPNIVNAALSASQSQALPAKGVWDLEITYASGDVVTVLAGKVTVTADVTTAITARAPATATAPRLRTVR